MNSSEESCQDHLAYDLADDREKARDRANDQWTCSKCQNIFKEEELQTREHQHGLLFCPECGSSNFEGELI